MTTAAATKPTNGNGNGNGNGAKSTALTPFQQKMTNIREFLAKNQRKIASAIPGKLVGTDRLVRIITTEIEKCPDLLECTPSSFWNAVIQVAQLGLEVGGVLGEAYFIPFNNNKKGCKEVQLVIGYKGFLALAYRSNRVKNVDARVVRDGDYFEYEYGTNARIVHKPAEQGGAVTHAYAVIELVGGGKHIEVMTIAELEKVRAASPGKNQDPWAKHTEEMQRKTVFRKAFKWAPKSAEASRAVSLDEQGEAGAQQLEGVIDAEAVESAPPNGSDSTTLDDLTEQARLAEQEMAR